MVQHTFPAMGTTIEVVVDGPTVDVSAAEAEFERLEAIMSRFRPESELSRLNREGSLDASTELAEVVTLALEARSRTRGLFDPTVHDALVAAGYDRTFEDLADDGGAAGARPCGGGVDVVGTRITLERGFRLDLGGIGKGFAAERVAELLGVSAPTLVSAGGDVAVRGLPAAGTWAVGIDEELTLGLDRGGVATSGVDRRRWRRGGLDRHHIVDPRTGLPAETDLVRVTAVARDAVEAEVLAKELLLSGSVEARAADVPAVLLTADGRMLRTGGL